MIHIWNTWDAYGPCIIITIILVDRNHIIHIDEAWISIAVVRWWCFCYFCCCCCWWMMRYYSWWWCFFPSPYSVVDFRSFSFYRCSPPAILTGKKLTSKGFAWLWLIRTRVSSSSSYGLLDFLHSLLLLLLLLVFWGHSFIYKERERAREINCSQVQNFCRFCFPPQYSIVHHSFIHSFILYI